MKLVVVCQYSESVVASGIRSRAEVKELEEKMTPLQSEKMTLEKAK